MDKCVPPVKTAWKRDDYAIYNGRTNGADNVYNS